MGRTIKLLLYYFAYQLAFMGVFLCGYMIFHHTTELPQSTDSTYITLILLPQVLSTAAVGIHLIVGKYVPLDRKTWAYYNSGKVLIVQQLSLYRRTIFYRIHPLAVQKHILTFAQYNFGSTLYIKYFLPNQRRVYQCCHKLPFGRESQLVKHLHSLSQLQIITLLAIEPQQ